MIPIGRTALALALFLISAVIPGRASIEPGPAWPPRAVLPHDRLKSRLLVAAPSRYAGIAFFYAVIPVVRHGPRGTLDIVIDRPVAKRPLADILAALGLKSEGAAGGIEVYAGGLSAQDRHRRAQRRILPAGNP